MGAETFLTPSVCIYTQCAHRHSSAFQIELLRPKKSEEERKECSEIVMVIKREDFRKCSLNELEKGFEAVRLAERNLNLSK